MAPSPTPPKSPVVRPLQYRDLEALEQLWHQWHPPDPAHGEDATRLQWIQRWYWPLTAMHWFPHPWQLVNHIYVAEYGAEQQGKAGQGLQGMIQVAPFNHGRSTWRIDQVLATGGVGFNGGLSLAGEAGSQLLRHCLEKIWEARTWIVDADVNDKEHLALYRQNGFQPLAQVTRWLLRPEVLQGLAEREMAVPNLLPVNNADAYLLYQLDTVSMPPLLRQVFDRHVADFQTSVLDGLVQQGQNWFSPYVSVRKYVFEPQRKAAIGSFHLCLSKTGSQPHKAKLTVHPAYTFLYPQLLNHMAQLTQAYPPQGLCLKSADYQPEREAFLEQVQADRLDHVLLMSRSVWHKLREQKGVSLEGLQLSEVLQGLQPSHNPVPGRFVPHSRRELWYAMPEQKTSPPQPPSSGDPE
ncbi:GNAT family N-acetyltransferase [Prochlorothrix hollandica]|uniref:GNAT family N-acetyltransferase n=1 Tax=Prochlorothrix hollandica TaxID=1223 RepID=UPI00333E9C6E